MRLLVIGGAGYVGRLVLPGLTERHQVRVLDLHPPTADCEYRQGDATDPTDLARACAGMDAVIHMAMAPTTPDDRVDPSTAFDVHVKSAYLTMLAAAKADVRHVVFVSSLSVFAALGSRQLGTDDEPDATDPYGLTKRLGEQAVRAAATATGTDLTFLRLAWPTPDDVWPAWEVGLAQTDYTNTQTALRRDRATAADPHPPLRFADGRPLPALAGSDLAAALLGALDTPDGIRTLPLTGDAAGALIDLSPTMAALSWSPTRTL
jgi:nucleoside-diphosphate-sugar epimerase